jgi:CPA1 family monovalent cation:H+ antiporter
MNGFDIAAILTAIAAVSGYVNHRFLRLPATSGTLVVSLVSSLAVLLADGVFPQLELAGSVAMFLGRIDFNETLMHGMLSFLLFAGALHVDLEGLLANKWTIGSLSTVGVLLSTAIVGVLTWWMFALIGPGVPIIVCLTFGALISPTDPIAVMGLLKELRAPRDLEAQIAGESLFNDGIGVVVFFAMTSLAGLSPGGHETALGPVGLLSFFARQVAGGVALGLGLGYLGYRALKSINDHPTELLITLALAMFMYSLSFWIHVSGPIAVVVAGLLIGNPGREFAMSARTREHVDAFWSMIDEILNAVLFLLIGLQVLGIKGEAHTMSAALLAIPIALVARFVSVGAPVAAMTVRGRLVNGIVPILTWSGLRGGLSVAMALSLPHFPGRDVVLACTYAVVVFSILVQGLTVRRLLVHYRVGETGI